MALYMALIIFFAFFYTAVVFTPAGDGGQPEEVRRLRAGHPAPPADATSWSTRD
jgi:hypothetical protein